MIEIYWLLQQQFAGLDVPPDNDSILAIRKMMEDALRKQWYDIWWVVAIITVVTTLLGNILTKYVTAWIEVWRKK